MSQYILPQRRPNRRAQALGLDIAPATGFAGFKASLSDAFARNPTPSVLRAAERARFTVPGQEDDQDRYGPRAPRPREQEPDERDEPTDYKVLSPEDATEKYGIEGRLSFDKPVAEPIARELRTLKQEEIARQDVMRRAESGMGTQLTAGLLASVADPLNVASAFVPAVGPARAAALTAKFGRGGGRAITGAAEGAVGATLLEPLVYGVAVQEQADYSATDSLLNVAFGSVMGAGLHLGVGAVGDKFSTGSRPGEVGSRAEASAEGTPLQKTVESMPRRDQEALLKTAVAQVLEGRPVRVGPALETARKALQERRPRGGRMLYHGTNRIDADRLKVGAHRQTAQGQDWTAHAVFLSDSKEVAEHFAKNRASSRGGPPRVAEVETRVENTLDLRDGLDEVQKIVDESDALTLNKGQLDQLKERPWAIFHGNFGRAFVKELQARGYDSARFRDDARAGEGTSYAVFDEASMSPPEYRAGGRRIPSKSDPEIRREMLASIKEDPMPEFRNASNVAAERVAEVKGEPEAVADLETKAKEDLAEVERMLDEEDQATLKEQAKDEDKLTRTYEKAWRMAATCRIRNAGSA